MDNLRAAAQNLAVGANVRVLFCDRGVHCGGHFIVFVSAPKIVCYTRKS